MTLLEFKEKLQTIHQTLFREGILDDKEADQSYFSALSLLTVSNDHVHPFFALREETGLTIEFIINN